MNAPHPAEHIVLNDGEKKIDYLVDTKLSDAGSFIILKEDHTVGNIIRMSLHRDRRVLFSGYRMPHPLENRLVVKIKTRPMTTPIDVMVDALDNLEEEVVNTNKIFKLKIQEHKQKIQMDNIL